LTFRQGWAEGEEGPFRKEKDMEIKVTEKAEEGRTAENALSHTSLVSFISEVPVPIKEAMTVFIEGHPSWDQYRLIQAALAGFLVQNGVESRAVTRLYLDNMFSRKSVREEL